MPCNRNKACCVVTRLTIFEPTLSLAQQVSEAKNTEEYNSTPEMYYENAHIFMEITLLLRITVKSV